MDADLLEELYRKYHRGAMLYCTALCGDPHLAQDIAAEAFIKAYLSLPDDIPSFRYWLLRVCKNLWYDHLRKEKHMVTSEVPPTLTDGTTPEETYIQKEKLRCLWWAICTLSPMVGVRNAPKDAEHAPFAVGFSAKPNGDLSLLDEQYPELGMLHTQADGSQMEEHFKSLLRFSADQLDKGKGIPIVTLTGNYYRDALAYVEENGVTSYGCLITGTPEGLLGLLEDNVASTLILTDGWIDVS